MLSKSVLANLLLCPLDISGSDSNDLSAEMRFDGVKDGGVVDGCSAEDADAVAVVKMRRRLRWMLWRLK